MEIRVDARIPHSRDVVFKVYRDDMTKLLPFLPNVRSIELKSRAEDGARTSIVLVWRGGGDIPTALRAVLSESMLSWTDYATWDAGSFTCDWRTEAHALADAVRSSGKNLFLEEAPGRTLLQVRATFEVDAKKIRGVPGFLAGKVGKAAEEFLGGKIEPNVAETARGVTQYLEKR
jgi:hypothetical protein